MSRPILSVITPTYNRAEFLERLLKSAQSTTVDCEFIVSDNASTDNTEQVIVSLAKSDPRIHYYRNETNLGPIKNYNVALRKAQGKYICVISDDDFVLPGNFEKKIALLDRNPHIGLVYSLWYRIDLQGKSSGINMWPGLLTYPYIGGRNEFLDLLPACYLALQSAVYRRELWDRLGGFDETPIIDNCGDWDMLLRYCYHTQTAFINEPLVAVAYHSQSGTETYLRSEGLMAKARIAIWRKWLVDNENPPVLDDTLWQRMERAFVPDLRWEFGDQTEKINEFLQQLKEIKRENNLRITRRFHGVAGKLSGDRVTEGVNVASMPAANDTVVQPSSKPLSLTAAPVNVAPVEPPCVVWNAPLWDPSGYADEARQFVLGLDELGVPVAAVPIKWNNVQAQLPTADRERLERLSASCRIVQPNAVSVCHIFAPFFERLRGPKFHVGRTMYETDRIPAEWVPACNKMDEIWVPSDFNIETFASSGVQREKLVKMHGAIDTSLFHLDAAPLDIPGRRAFNFLSVFDWQQRKGWDVLLSAFIEEFGQDDDVALIIKTWSSFGKSIEQIKEDAVNYLRQCGIARDLPPNIVFYQENLSLDQMSNLYRAVDAFVLPTSGEGWGRPFMEAMLMELPVIGTRWSGQLEFMKDDNSYLIDCKIVDVSERSAKEVPNFRGHRCAAPSKTHLQHHMQEVYTNREVAAAKGKAARRYIVANFDRKHIAERVKQRLDYLRGIDDSRQFVSSVNGNAKEHPSHLDVSQDQSVSSIYSSPTDKSLPISVVWEGAQFVHHSLALVNREVSIKLAQNKHVELSLLPFGAAEFGAKGNPRLKQIARCLNKELSHPAEFHVRHVWPPILTPPPNGHWIVMQPWEFGSIPRAWIEAWRDQIDELWVYTNYVRDCYVQSGMAADRIQIIPCGVDMSKFHPKATRLKLKTKKKFKFLFVGGTIGRKGIDVLLKAYVNTFSSADDVCLIVKDMGGKSFYKGQTAHDLIGHYAAMPNAPEIEYIDRMLNDQELAGLYTACDCLAHPYRGEGFGLPIAEAMASGVPVIVTGHGAAVDFCNEDNAYLIPATVFKQSDKFVGDMETVDHPWWYEPDMAALQEHMKHVFEHRDEAKAKGRAGCEHIRANFTWDIMAKLMQARFEVLRDAPIRRFAKSPTVDVAVSGKQESESTGAQMGDESVRLLLQILEKAEWCEKQGESEKALELYREALTKSPSSLEAVYNVGRLELMGGDVANAVTHLRESVLLAPWHTLACSYLGLALQAIGDYEGAVTHLEVAVAHGGASVPIMRCLADAYLAVSRYKEAIALYKQLTETSEGQASDAVGMAEAFKGLGQLSFAQECYEIALEIDPSLEAAAAGLQLLRQVS